MVVGLAVQLWAKHNKDVSGLEERVGPGGSWLPDSPTCGLLPRYPSASDSQRLRLDGFHAPRLVPSWRRLGQALARA